MFGGITIQELTGDARPTAQAGSNVVPFSRLKVGWQTTFKLGNELLPITASVRTRAQGEGGRIARSLAQGLLLPEDVQFFMGRTDRS